MSATYSIGCTACKRRRWIGQSLRIYSEPVYIGRLAAFLHKHKGPEHPLIFDEDCNSMTFEDFTDDGEGE